MASARVWAAPPAWVADEGRSAFPLERYFTGYGQAVLGSDAEQCRRLAVDQAKSALIQSVSVSIKSSGSTRLVQKGEEASESVSSAVESVSALDIKGLKTEFFSEPKKDRCHALAAAGKADLAAAYGAKSESLRGEVAALVSDARRAESSGDRSKALERYLDARAKLADFQDARSIAALAGGKPPESSSPLPGAGELRAAINRLAERPVKTLEDAAWLLAFGLKSASDLPDARVQVQPFTFRDTKMTSPLSRYLKEALESRLAEAPRWTVVAPKPGQASAAAFLLTGTYWEQAGSVRLVARLRRLEGGAFAAAAEAEVPAAVLAAAKLDLKPENYKDALRDQGLFGADELQGGGLSVDAWTNKGEDGLFFSRGEKMKVFVRLNLPGYVRLIYHLADGKRVLLLDNYYLDAGKVNQAYELPQEFECDAPFGAETLQAFASTDKFSALATRNQDGYDYLAEDLGQALVKTRGMKRAKAGTLKAETRLTLTTMEK